MYEVENASAVHMDKYPLHAKRHTLVKAYAVGRSDAEDICPAIYKEGNDNEALSAR